MVKKPDVRDKRFVRNAEGVEIYSMAILLIMLFTRPRPGMFQMLLAWDGFALGKMNFGVL